ncbi:uncharacterized protein Triagg1_6519 [Trichoderma aggressivum f. europaeum]|uniref:Uncharacterized protein n=1 Tax=Trichoderma aggressivum f. europaeum TaxID=173218 RepID=A0AAE1J7A4_9HYPO|nr:hypothetical protein Triagg1_6519 [Trichoderma aggressivum f. europaeum]
MAVKPFPHPIHFFLVALLFKDTYSYHRSFNLEITGVIDPEIDVGWVSFVTVSLLHRRRRIGEKTLYDMHIILDEKNEVTIKLEGFQIQSMVRFRDFALKMMPKLKANRQKSKQAPVMAALDTDDNGHELFISIDLGHMLETSILDLTVQFVNKRIRIVFKISSGNPVDLAFGWCQFQLKKDKTSLAFLDGHFDIQPDKCEIVMEGEPEIADPVFSGKAVLKGVKTYDNSKSWLALAIQAFEMEVNLDKVVMGEAQAAEDEEDEGNEGNEGGEGDKGDKAYVPDGRRRRR